MENNIYLIAQNQSTSLHIYNTDRPLQPLQWLLPESLTGFHVSHLHMPGGFWEELNPNKSYRMKREEPLVGACTIDVYTEHDFIGAELSIENRSGKEMQDVISDVCCGIRNSADLMKNAIDHAYVKARGEYRGILDTDRSTSKNGVMPNYAIAGQPLCPKWRDSHTTDYGFGLSGDRAESSMVLMHGESKREWIATFFTSANELWFNVLEPWHGCMHSNTFKPTLEAGETWRIRGRIYYHDGTLEEMVEKYESAMKVMEHEN